MTQQITVTALGAAVIGVSWMEAFLSIVFIILRLYTRASFSHAGFGIDDLLISISGVLVIASAAANTVATYYGFGEHYTSLTAGQFSMTILFEMVCETTMLVGIVTSKSAVAWFLMRLVVQPWHKVVLWVIMATLAISCLSTAILNWLQCTPIDYTWSTREPGKGTCWLNISNPSIVAGVWSALTDFALAGLPWLIIMPLNMKKSEKISIAASLSLGVFAAVCGIVRTVELKQLEDTIDYTYATVPTLLWALTELTITIICANIPCLRPLYYRVRTRMTSIGKDGYTSEQTPDSTNLETIGAKCERQQGKLAQQGWSAVDEEDITLAEALAGTSHGKYSTSAIAGPATSSESILREDRQQQRIHVKEDINVSVEAWPPHDRN